MKIKRSTLMMQIGILQQFGGYRGIEFAEYVDVLTTSLRNAAQSIQKAIDAQYSPDQLTFVRDVVKSNQNASPKDMLDACTKSGRTDGEEIIRISGEVDAFMDGEIEIGVPSIEKPLIPKDISVAHYSLLKDYINVPVGK